MKKTKLQELIEQKEFEDLLQKYSKMQRFKLKTYFFLYKNLIKLVNKHYASHSLALLNSVVKKNSQVVQSNHVHIRDLMFQEYQNITEKLAYIERFYVQYFRYVKEAKITKDTEIDKLLMQIKVKVKEEEENHLVFFDLQQLKGKEQREQARKDYREATDIQDFMSGEFAKMAQELYNESQKKELLSKTNYKHINVDCFDNVFIYNLKEPYSMKKINVEQISFVKICRLIKQVFEMQWFYIVLLFVFFYHFFNSGIISILVPILLLVYGFLEEIRPKAKTWFIGMIFISLTIFFKSIFYLNIFVNNNDANYVNKLQVFFGDHGSCWYEITIILFFLIENDVVASLGLSQKSVNEVENAYSGFLRKSLNEDYEVCSERNFLKNIKHCHMDITAIKPTLYIEIFKDIQKEIILTFQLIKESNFTKFFMRIFSKHNYKAGKDFYPWLLGIQLIIIIYILLVFTKMRNSDAEGFAATMKSSQFSVDMVVTLFIHIGIVLTDRLIAIWRQDPIKVQDMEEELKKIKEEKKRIRKEKQVKEDQELKIMQLQGIENQKQDAGLSTFSHEENFELLKPEEQEGEEEKQLSSKYKIYLKKRNEFLHLSLSGYFRGPVFLRFIFLIFTVIYIHFMVFFYLPTNGKLTFKLVCASSTEEINECYYYKLNAWVLVFYLFYLFYFLFSVLQIKYGFVQKSERGIILRHYNEFNNAMIIVYMTIPFLFEVKTIMDWTFTSTALRLYNWIKFEEIQLSLYDAKMNAEEFFEKEIGEKIRKTKKGWMGCGSLIGLIILIFGPMVLFSSLNPITETNPVTGSKVTLSIVINQTNYFEIFTNSHVNNLHYLGTEEYNEAELYNIPIFRASNLENMQYFEISPFSDHNWIITEEGYESLRQLLFYCARNDNSKIYLEFTYQIQRKHINTDEDSNTILFELPQDKQIYSLIDSMANCSQSPYIIDNFYTNIIQYSYQNGPSPVQTNGFEQDIALDMLCTNDGAFRYWTFVTLGENQRRMVKSANENETFSDNFNPINKQTLGSVNGRVKEPITFFVLCDKYSPALLGYSFIGFYISVVYLLGRFVRLSIDGLADNFLLSDVPYPEPLIEICDAIVISRNQCDHYREEMLYYYLIDLLRSPEVVKALTGSCVEEIKEKKKKEEEEKMELEQAQAVDDNEETEGQKLQNL